MNQFHHITHLTDVWLSCISSMIRLLSSMLSYVIAVWWKYNNILLHLLCLLLFAFSALMLLVERQEGHLACKNWVVRYWHGYLSGVRCKSCSSKIQNGFPFLVPDYPGCPVKKAIKRLYFVYYYHHYHDYYLHLMAIFPGEAGSAGLQSGTSPSPVVEENFWQLAEWSFYGPDAHPATQPSVSNHWREHIALTLTSVLTSSFLHPPPDSWWKGRSSLYTGSPTPVTVSLLLLLLQVKFLRQCDRHLFNGLFSTRTRISRHQKG